jgi:recombination protein RecR
MIPKILQKVMDDFQRLPGIGEKTAERLALFLISDMEEEQLIDFSEHLKKLKSEIKTCPVCHMLTDHDLCDICADETRDQTQIMVVSDAKDVFIL